MILELMQGTATQLGNQSGDSVAGIGLETWTTWLLNGTGLVMIWRMMTRISDVRDTATTKIGEHQVATGEKIGQFQVAVTKELGELKTTATKELGEFQASVTQGLGEIKAETAVLNRSFEDLKDSRERMETNFEKWFQALQDSISENSALLGSVERRFEKLDSVTQGLKAQVGRNEERLAGVEGVTRLTRATLKPVKKKMTRRERASKAKKATES